MSDLLQHPLFILVVGAVLSGVLFPELVNRGQDRQKEIALKTELVSDLSEMIMKILMSVQFAHVRAAMPARSPEDMERFQREFDSDYQDWEVKNAVMHAKLEAYFPETTIAQDWAGFCDVVTNFYALEGIHDDERKLKLEQTIRKRLAEMLGPGTKLGDDWEGMREGILLRKAQLIQHVLKAKVTPLSAQRPIFGWGRSAEPKQKVATTTAEVQGEQVR